jgi:hypothetical protein
MASDDIEMGRGQSSNPLEKTVIGQTIISLNPIMETIDTERKTNGLGERGRALSLALTKLDEARLWLKEANLL